MNRLSHSFSPVNLLSNQKHHVPCNEKPRAITGRLYVARLIDINDYLTSFPGATLNDKIDVTKLEKIFLNGMPKSCSRQAYAQVFYCESITFEKDVNMF